MEGNLGQKKSHSQYEIHHSLVQNRINPLLSLKWDIQDCQVCSVGHSSPYLYSHYSIFLNSSWLLFVTALLPGLVCFVLPAGLGFSFWWHLPPLTCVCIWAQKSLCCQALYTHPHPQRNTNSVPLSFHPCVTALCPYLQSQAAHPWLLVGGRTSKGGGGKWKGTLFIRPWRETYRGFASTLNQPRLLDALTEQDRLEKGREGQRWRQKQRMI